MKPLSQHGSVGKRAESEHQRRALRMLRGGPRFQPRTSPDTHLTPKNTPLRFLNSVAQSEPINRQISTPATDLKSEPVL
jgi:hypothetical protein